MIGFALRFIVSAVIASALILFGLMLPDSWDRTLTETLEYSRFFAIIGLSILVSVCIGLCFSLLLHSALKSAFISSLHSKLGFFGLAFFLGWLMLSLMSDTFLEAWPGAAMGLVSAIVFAAVYPKWFDSVDDTRATGASSLHGDV